MKKGVKIMPKIDESPIIAELDESAYNHLNDEFDDISETDSDSDYEEVDKSYTEGESESDLVNQTEDFKTNTYLIEEKNEKSAKNKPLTVDSPCFKAWIYGQANTGKHRFIKTIKNAKIFSFSDSRFNEKFFKDLDQLDLILEKLALFPKNMLIVIDKIEDMYEFIRLEYLKSKNVSHEADIPFKGYDAVKQEFLSRLELLLMCNRNVIFLSNEIEINVNGDIIFRPNLPQKFIPIISQNLDVIVRTIKNVHIINGKIINCTSISFGSQNNELFMSRKSYKNNIIESNFDEFILNLGYKN